MKKLITKFNLSIGSIKNIGRNPSIDWRLSIICFAIILIIFIIIHLYIYSDFSLKNQNNGGQNVSTEFLNRENVNNIVKELEEKDLDTTLIPDKALNDPSI
jgi:hypothetical protein